MKCLLDTHALVWFAADAREFSATARNVIDEADAVFMSAASLWEMAIKKRLGKLRLDDPIEVFAQNALASGLLMLPIDGKSVFALDRLPLRGDHRDPFDRMLIAQAIAEDVVFLSPDRAMHQYGIDVRW